MKKIKSAPIDSLPKYFRLITVLGLLLAILLLASAVYIIVDGVTPVYGRLWRNAPIIEVQYIAYALLAAPFIAILMGYAAIAAFTTRKVFSPEPGTRAAKFQSVMFKLFLKTLLYVSLPLPILTTLWLVSTGYSLCNDLRPSGSGWQTFWVNNKNACFKPDTYINDHWPCKVVDGKKMCLQADGR
ncbi:MULTISPECIES: hypothetical protein [Pseudomonas syringae group]|uniref:Transmembrane protein n=4 Tax=Pseudomonas syringae group TaxID=136849 RepID=F3G2N9_PSESJ|nr:MULTISPECIES: hypothetical protein [Pseudomonas syringae group]EGH41339.1 hypothetical protein PSYPI_02467 [Pseudomonas syringae pv. pisi str. 1704B]RMU69750.1 hypothetical protein ALP24_00960 [Pseudomonas syringae pv. aptata]PYD10688.1 hypothetical protein DND62_18110 [Pseudomonas syringae pv. pisi]PYD28384.1 hypothetical protein DND67_19430 [Pseudomonas syringae pv. pisi]PYD29886.1 hypothetical protein DND58_18965 [Pseudomonas syringae pv. pisi]